jgi:hypothetical protein
MKGQRRVRDQATRNTKRPVRLSLLSFERWLASDAATACRHRVGRPCGDAPPLVQTAAHHFGVDRRTVQRALARLERRRRLLAEHQVQTPATAAMLLEAARSFVVGKNATEAAVKLRHTARRETTETVQQRLTAAQPSPEALLDAIAVLLRTGALDRVSIRALVMDVVEKAPPSHPERSGDALTAIGLTDVTPSKRLVLLTTPVQDVQAVLLEALDAYQSCVAPLPSEVVQIVDRLRGLLAPPRPG